MTQKNKDKIVGGLIGTGGSIIAGSVILLFTSLHNGSKDFETTVKGKLDRDEYYDDQEARWQQYNKDQAAQDKTYTIQINAVNENMSKILERVDWLYRNEIKKNGG